LIPVKKYLRPLEIELLKYGVITEFRNDVITFKKNKAAYQLRIVSEDGPAEDKITGLPLDLLIHSPLKVAGLVLSKLHCNNVIFARKCELIPIDKLTANKFIDEYHFLNSTNAPYNRGLFYNNELVAVAAFSKGRKMNRLSENERSFELIRFCTRIGVTVAGGLTKLVTSFCRDKKAGDIMTYVDKQFSNGKAFSAAGFIFHSEAPPVKFNVERKSHKRSPANSNEENKPDFYPVYNEGNIKMIFKCNERV
jgi:hypothetical protein